MLGFRVAVINLEARFLNRDEFPKKHPQFPIYGSETGNLFTTICLALCYNVGNYSRCVEQKIIVKVTRALTAKKNLKCYSANVPPNLQKKIDIQNKLDVIFVLIWPKLRQL